MKENYIDVMVVEPGFLPVMKRIENTLEASQELVGGYIETYYDAKTRALLVMNEEGRLRGLKPNVKLPWRETEPFVGTVFICTCDDDGNFCSLNRNSELWRHWWGLMSDMSYRCGGVLECDIFAEIECGPQKWDYEKHEYSPYSISPEWHCPLKPPYNTSERINCAACGSVLNYCDSYASFEIHNAFGLGYPVCGKCYKAELQRCLEDDTKGGADDEHA